MQGIMNITAHHFRPLSCAIYLASSWGKMVAVLLTMLAALALTQTGFAQTSSASHAIADPQSDDWIAANNAVGKFLRGHIDILRAEARGLRNQGSEPSQDADIAPSGELLTLQKAKMLFLQARPSLFATGAESAAERSRQAITVIEGLSRVERAWIQAIGSQLMFNHQKQATRAAEIAEELARRMGRLGNWGAARVIPVQQQASAQRLKMLQAGQRAQETRNVLASLVQMRAFDLPDSLPAIAGIGARSDLNATAEALALDRLQRSPEYSSRVKELQRLESSVGKSVLEQWQAYVRTATASALGDQGPQALSIDRSAILWGHDIQKALFDRESLDSLRVQTETTIAIAQAQVRTRHAQSMLLTLEALPLAIEAEEQAVYQYNGMFIDTWNLLQQFRARQDTQIAQIDAQMQYWDAHYAFQAYLAGASYVAPSAGSTGDTTGSGAAGAGH